MPIDPRRSALRTACENMNHRRSNAPVSHCPQCGDSVNASVRSPACTESTHAQARRQRSVYCVHCGTQLIRP
jgi:predicted RNA-binding Zn-ribbon protein involved in translation (DUF1610 family)